MKRQVVETLDAPRAIGTYSQGVVTGDVLYLSGQIPLNPRTMELVQGGIDAQIHQVFRNLASLANAVGASLDSVVKLNVYLTDLAHFADVNTIMAMYFSSPYPARAVLGVAALPRGACIEADAILALGKPD